MTQESEKAVRITVIGTVQGVSYRAWTVNAAKKIGLQGWVRNRIDGTVEIQAIGSKDQINTLLYACRKGPPLAAVADVKARIDNGQLEKGGFVQKGTA